MTNPKQRHCLLVGLPAAGKTTFLAALWHLVHQIRMPCALKIDRLKGSSRYLNEMSNAWLNCTAVPRTNPGSEAIVAMELSESATGRVMTVVFPDLSGESFESQWTTRTMTQTFEKQLGGATGALFFINPTTVVEPTRIDQVAPAIAEVEALLADAAQDHSTDQHDLNESLPWKPEEAPTQVQLVELLQFIDSRRSSRVPFRSAVMISAWDRVALEGLTPAHWLRARMPLLWQYLTANERAFDSVIFGVSAQGGEYDAAVREQLSRMTPGERVQLVGSAVSNSHDLTEPIQWLMR